ncbi:MAG: hypothetical protein GX877_02020 [Bacteroidales bacterium]|nr:hypothetical protein [Bacteroidales bacterium]
MKKAIFLFLGLTLLFIACSKQDAQNLKGYTEIQKEVLQVLNGKFRADGYSGFETFESFSKPRIVYGIDFPNIDLDNLDESLKNLVPAEVHGRIHFPDEEYNFPYFRISEDGKTLTFVGAQIEDRIIFLFWKYDFVLLSKSSFKIKFHSDPNEPEYWEVYRKIK